MTHSEIKESSAKKRVRTARPAGKCPKQKKTSASCNFLATHAVQAENLLKKGEKNSWGNKDRDALYLKYEINVAGMKVVTTDTLVMRDRTVALETFTPVAK